MRIDVFVHLVSDAAADAKLDAILAKLHTLLQKETQTMALLDDLAADVTAQTTVIDSAVTLLNGLSAQLAAAGTDPVKLAAVKNALDANTASLAAAVVANTAASPNV